MMIEDITKDKLKGCSDEELHGLRSKCIKFHGEGDLLDGKLLQGYDLLWKEFDNRGIKIKVSGIDRAALAERTERLKQKRNTKVVEKEFGDGIVRKVKQTKVDGLPDEWNASLKFRARIENDVAWDWLQKGYFAGAQVDGWALEEIYVESMDGDDYTFVATSVQIGGLSLVTQPYRSFGRIEVEDAENRIIVGEALWVWDNVTADALQSAADSYNMVLFQNGNADLPIGTITELTTGDLVDKSEEPSTYVKVMKVDDARQEVGGVVYPANKEDAHGDWATADDIHDAMVDYMIKSRKSDIMHDRIERSDIHIIECFQADAETVKGGGTINAGDWWATAKIESEETWGKVKSGELAGWSLDGFAEVL